MTWVTGKFLKLKHFMIVVTNVPKPDIFLMTIVIQVIFCK